MLLIRVLLRTMQPWISIEHDFSCPIVRGMIVVMRVTVIVPELPDADDQNENRMIEVLLGRTVLNRLILLLDGSGSKADLRAHRSRRLSGLH